MKNNKCIDCEKRIWKDSIRCKSCAKKGELNSNFKNRTYKCKICGKKISHKAKKCLSCRSKNYWKNHPEKRVRKHYCLDCGTEIYPYKNTKRCKSCATRGKNNGMFGKIGAHGKGEYYKGIYMRSGYEIAYAKYLDKWGIKWRYEKITFNLGDTTYTPDFYILRFDCYIEIKGFWRDDAEKKFKLFKKLYPKVRIKILMQKDLEEIGVL